MYRDFSERSRRELLSLVQQVENEKLCDFTDWVGDRWYDFESWIGQLNIKNYLNNVNEYHRKVIDKNNATQATINAIFSSVKSVDTSYMSIFSARKDQLQQWQRYIEELYQIVNPRNGKFNGIYIVAVLDKKLNDMEEMVANEDVSDADDVTIADAVKFESKVLKALSKLTKDKGKSNDLGIASSSMSYIASLITFYTADYEGADDIAVGGLKLTKSSTSMWNGVYKYLENNLKPLDASRFGKKYQSKVGWVSLVGSICGFTSDAVGTVKTLVDEDAEAYEKIVDVLKTSTSGLDVSQSVVNLKWGQKVLTRDVTAKYQWGTAASNVSKIDKATAVISVLGVTADALAGGTERYGQVTEDGTLDMGDMGEIGVATGIRGLTSVVDKATFGISDALGLSDQAEAITDGVIEYAKTDLTDYARNHNFSSEYAKNAGFLVDYSNDEENNIILRIGASAVAGTGMIGALVVDGVSDCCIWIGDTFSNAWNGIKSWF